MTRMTIKLKPKAIVHFILIYIMICWADTYVFIEVFSDYSEVIAIGLIVVPLLSKKYRDYVSIGLYGLLLLVVILVRYTVGGVGLEAWSIWGSCILLTVIVIRYNNEKFMERYVRVIVFLAMISIVLYAISNIAPGLFDMLPFSHYRSGSTYNVWTSAFDYTTYEYYNDGLWFFVRRENEVRNISIFTEPGLYQMHLNTALCMILFFTDKLNMRSKKIRNATIVLVIAHLTCQSTTGLIGFAVILFVYLLYRQREVLLKKWKLVALFFIVVGFVIGEYIVNQENSMFYNVVIKKLFEQSMTISGSSISTGAYRLETIRQSIGLIFENPLGRGFDAVHASLNAYEYAGATVFMTAAGIGVIPVICMLVYVMRPIIKSRIGVPVKLLLIFLYFNTLFAQSSELYPALICIPLYLSYGYLYVSEGLQNSREPKKLIYL